jgi:rubrerythrin
MPSSATLEILKQAILLEKRSRAFYRHVAQQTSHRAVETFFSLMAAEEEQHIDMLSRQYKAFKNDRRLAPMDYPAAGEPAAELSHQVLTAELVDAVAAAGFEAAAIGAAMALEQKAVDLYAQRSDAAADAEEKALYHWLSRWEHTHLEFLATLDREMTQKIWHDQQFWPF